jgi:hypothetical protein
MAAIGNGNRTLATLARLPCHRGGRIKALGLQPVRAPVRHGAGRLAARRSGRQHAGPWLSPASPRPHPPDRSDDAPADDR